MHAHVVPKAKSFPEEGEEEKTTIESQWEDEASTTVEEGDVADKIRALGVEPRRANGTSVTGTGAGSSALDEPTVDEAHLSALTPVRDVARLQITQGNDTGRDIEIRPGKGYTIGRAIDNDVVLTDIAVSRKHFDLRFEDGAWVIVDRGSGNGTVVNGNLEDNPFMLANGDMIEIGNTVFRFDQPNAAARPARSDGPASDSTGLAARTVDLDEEELSTVAGKPPMRHDVGLAEPAPLAAIAARPLRAKTLPPPAPLRAATANPKPPLGFAPVATAVPLPASTLPAPPLARSSAPLPGMAAPTMLDDSGGVHVNGLPSSSPMATGSAQRPIYTYPQATEIPPHSVHAQMLLIQTQNRRGDGSTVLVPPTPYDAIPAHVPRYLPPQLTKRARLVLGGVGLAVLAAVLTVAIAKSGGDSPALPAASKDRPVPLESPPVPAKTANPGAFAPTPENIEPTPEPVIAIAKTEPTPEPVAALAKTDPTTDPRPEPKASPRPEPRPAAKAEKPTKRTVEKAVDKAVDKAVEKIERREPRREPTAAPAPAKRVAALDPDAAKDQADDLYRAKRFNDASSLLASAAKKLDEADARELRRTAELYGKLGRALAQGTAPATKSTEAFEALRQAQAHDRNVGGAFDSEIQTKLGQIAPKAALSYMAAKNYPSARSAVLAAQQLGSSESVKLVSQKLESVAGEIYNEGVRELSTNPSAAKDKFRQVKAIVDAKSTWYQKAQKQLQGG